MDHKKRETAGPVIVELRSQKVDIEYETTLDKKEPMSVWVHANADFVQASDGASISGLLFDVDPRAAEGA